MMKSTSSSPEFYKAMISVKNRKEIRIETALAYTDNVLDWYRGRDQVRIMNIHLESM
jgi:hypothetical protein